MAEESTPVAAPAEAVTEATPNITPAEAPATAEAPAEPTKAPEAPVEKPYFSNDQLSEMQKFIEANGGYEKAWSKMKGNISAPQKAVEQPAEAPKQPEPVKTPEAPQSAPYTPREGTYSLEELAAQSYFERLAGDEKYANIADEIKSGKVLEGLRNFNIEPITNGRVNDRDIRKYLDLYAASKPAKPTSSEPTASPSMMDNTAGITKITTREEADRIQLEDIRRRAAGQPGHPLAEEAKNFVKDYYKNLGQKK